MASHPRVAAFVCHADDDIAVTSDTHSDFFASASDVDTAGVAGAAAIRGLPVGAVLPDTTRLRTLRYAGNLTLCHSLMKMRKCFAE